MQYLNKPSLKWFKLIGLLTIIVFMSLVGSYFINDKDVVSKHKRNYAIVKTNSRSNEVLPNLCEYEVDEVEDTVYQNCLNLYKTEKKYILVEFSFFSEAKFEELQLIDQDDNVINSRIINSSIRAFELQGYVEPCKNYCTPSRVIIQFEIDDNVQVKGLRIGNFTFREDIKTLDIIGFDPSDLNLKVIYIDSEMNDYFEMRKALEEPAKINIVVNKSYKTPDSTKPDGVENLGTTGIELNLNFINVSNTNEKKLFNQKFHSTTLTSCLNRIIKARIAPFSDIEVCNYLVNQFAIANEFGDAHFSIPLHEARLPNGPSNVKIDPFKITFFESLLTNSKNVSIKLNESDDLKNFQAMALRASYWLSPNANIETFK